MTAQITSPFVSPAIPPAKPCDARTFFALHTRYFGDVAVPSSPTTPRLIPTIPPTFEDPLTDRPASTAVISPLVSPSPVTRIVPFVSFIPARPPTPVAFPADILRVITLLLSSITIFPLLRPAIPPTFSFPDAEILALLVFFVRTPSFRFQPARPPTLELPDTVLFCAVVQFSIVPAVY